MVLEAQYMEPFEKAIETGAKTAVVVGTSVVSASVGRGRLSCWLCWHSLCGIIIGAWWSYDSNSRSYGE